LRGKGYRAFGQFYAEASSDQQYEGRSPVISGPVGALFSGWVDTPLDLDILGGPHALGRIDEVP
jgi:hypothetical protein